MLGEACLNLFELDRLEVDTKHNDRVYLTEAQDDVVPEESCDLLID